MADRTRPDEQYLDLPDDDGLGSEHLDNQVQKAQEQLVALKRQQEMIERQKRELEELSRKQEQLQQGKQEMVEKFTRAIVVLEREHYDAQKRVELLNAIHDSFNQHLEVLDGINPKSWEGLDINKELTKALSAVDDSRAEYARSLPKISAERSSDGGGDPVAASVGYQAAYGAVEVKDFTYWLKAGFAFTLPLFSIGVIVVVVLIALFNH
jgi:predicted RNase H-like nuclease (RuvC/YqgF family)